MPKHGPLALAICLLVSSLLAQNVLAQSGDSGGSSGVKLPTAPARTQEGQSTPFTVGVDVNVSTLGIGGDIAVPVARHFNARAGFNLFNYNATFDNDNVSYKGTLALQSVHALFDIFPFRGGFHLSPGLLFYNQNNVKANASVAGNQTFTLNSVDYLSNPSNPLTGTGKLTMKETAPMLLLGFGNLIPRTHRHITYSIEFGAAYQGTPGIALNFTGSACDTNGAFCRNVATDPGIQANVQAQQTKIRKDLNPFKFYPILSFGLGYKF